MLQVTKQLVELVLCLAELSLLVVLHPVLVQLAEQEQNYQLVERHLHLRLELQDRLFSFLRSQISPYVVPRLFIYINIVSPKLLNHNATTEAFVTSVKYCRLTGGQGPYILR